MERLTNGGDALSGQLERVSGMDAAALRRLWPERRGSGAGSTAPTFLSARLMRLALAWEIQTDVLGGEQKPVARAWDRIAAARAAGASPGEAMRGAPQPAVPAGTRLIRTWQGQAHEVWVRPDGGVAWRGRTYRSLSAVARVITGTNRNGPAFFGLRGAQGGQ